MFLCRIKEMDQGLDFTLLSLGYLNVFTSMLFRLSFHEVFMWWQVGKSNSAVLDSVLVELAINRLKQKSTDVFLYKLVSKIFVETKVSEVPTPLSVLVEILCILQHDDHEINGIWRSNFRITMKDFSDVCETCGSIEHCLGVFSLFTKSHNCVNDICFNTVILHFVWVLCIIKQLLVSLIILQDILEALRNLSKYKSIDFTLLVCT